MELDKDSLVADLSEIKSKPSDVDPALEAAHLCELIQDPNISRLLADYVDPAIRGVGGSGLIIRALHAPSGSYRALKFPRYRLYHVADQPADVEGGVEVDPELLALQKLSHQNITRLHTAFPLPNGRTYCMITEYVASSRPLDRYAYDLCCTTECRRSREQLQRALRTLAEIVYQIVDGLTYMHDVATMYHLDVKPENLLVADTGIPYIADLGFARDLSKHSADDTIQIGFTWKYAHPRLHDTHMGARVTKVPEKAKIPLLVQELSPKFDIFAFGRSLQEVLAQLDREYGEYIHSEYYFGYLHLVACLCLDGRNSVSTDDRGSFISDVAMGMPARTFALAKFNEFRDVRTCLQRLLGLRRFEDELPEVDTWYSSTIKVSDLGNATLTARVANIINHPALQRLKKENQLGMLDSVFPTATHSRFQHTLGTYHAATQYLAALYYDPDNPAFRALVDIDLCKSTLVAALVHDLGHTAYGHELEEIDKSEFNHTEFLSDILRSKTLVDPQGRTLREIIESDRDGCWGSTIDKIERLLHDSQKINSVISEVLHDILDSQIDADKFDYLLRDSVECRVSYGHGIDFGRFLRSLTTHAHPDGRLRLAVKQKGAASAESFALARYQLYQSLYWHHTFRATKAMLLESVRLVLEDLQQSGARELFDQHPLRTAYIRNVIGVSDFDPQRASPPPPAVRSADRRTSTPPTISSIIAQRLDDQREVKLPIPYDGDETMRFLWRLSTGPARELLSDLISRSYYKRVLEISPSELPTPAWERLRDEFMSIADRGRIQTNVQSSLLNVLNTKAQSRSQNVMSLAEDGMLSRITELSKNRALFLVDIPLRGWFSTGNNPTYVSDYKRRHFRAEAAQRGFEVKQNFWTDRLGELMKEVAFVRVFCEPEIHGIVTRVMNTSDILAAVQEAIPALGQLRGPS